jgi:hypothetical protein
LADASTGKVIRTLPVSGSSISAAFIPPDGRRILAFWTDPDEKPHTATFDSTTAQMVSELSERPADSGGFTFTNTPAGVRYLAGGPEKGPKYQFASPEPGREVSPVPLPAGDFAILDLRGSTLLLESRAALITVSAWDWTHPERSPVSIQSREYSGAAVHIFLADGGRHVLRWNDGGRALVIYESSNGRVSGRLNFDGPIRSYALDPTGGNVVFALNHRMVFVDAANAKILSRSTDVLSGQEVLSLFWFRPKP